MEGHGVTTGSPAEPEGSVAALGGESVPDSGAVGPQSGNEGDVTQGPPPPEAVLPPVPEAETEQPAEPSRPRVPPVRVDARLLEATLLNLRKRVAGIPLVLNVPGSDEVAAERTKLLAQIDDYLLPRVRRSGAPLLVALVGSTGAGKSTLINSIVGQQISATGVRRPTTNSPVLACHPDDMSWFAENMFLPTLPRVRQEGLVRPGRDGLLVLAASEGMSKGVALLDTPDIDSVVRAHHEFAYQFLDASDLWLFMTSASRYADAPVWEILQHARERGAALGVVLSRVPPAHRDELTEHFTAMLEANGISANDRFVIPETPILDGMLPAEVFGPVRDWLAETAQREGRRVAVLTQTMSGVLDTFKIRVPKLAAHVDDQVVLRGRLRREAESAYRAALSDFDAATRSGSLLGGEVLARWQDSAASGDLDDALRSRKPRKGRRARRGQAGTRTSALDTAVRSALESLVIDVADRAAELTSEQWNDNPAGAALLSQADQARAEDDRVERVFTDAFGSGQSLTSAALDRASPDLSERAARAISAWQDQLIRLLGGERNARRHSYEGEALSLVLIVTVLGDLEDGVPRKVLTSVFGQVETTELIARARADLLERVRLLLDEELLRFVEVLDSVGALDEIAAVRLYQAEYSLEAAR
jgi:energy-coupling factor transporter ATP-binding protein EcfA2